MIATPKICTKPEYSEKGRVMGVNKLEWQMLSNPHPPTRGREKEEKGLLI